MPSEVVTVRGEHKVLLETSEEDLADLLDVGLLLGGHVVVEHRVVTLHFEKGGF